MSLMWGGRTGFIETLGTQFTEYTLLACKCISTSWLYEVYWATHCYQKQIPK